MALTRKQGPNPRKCRPLFSQQDITNAGKLKDCQLNFIIVKILLYYIEDIGVPLQSGSIFHDQPQIWNSQVRRRLSAWILFHRFKADIKS